MRRLLGYSGKVDNLDPRLLIYRVFGIEVRVPYTTPDLDQALADTFGMTKVEFLAAEATWDDLKAQYQAALTQIANDDAERAADLAALPGMTQAQVAAAFGRSLQREGRQYNREQRIIKVLARLILNDDRPEAI